MERYRIRPDNSIYYCTFAIVDWLPVFVSEASCRILSDSLRFCCEHKQLAVDAYVIMPTHAHLIVYDQEDATDRLEKTLTDLRKFTGRALVEHAAKHLPAVFLNAFQAASGDDREHRFWQPTRHAEAVNSAAFHEQKRNYLHDNPRRKGLVLDPTHWRWSSARWYATGETGDVPITPVIW